MKENTDIIDPRLNGQTIKNNEFKTPWLFTRKFNITTLTFKTTTVIGVLRKCVKKIAVCHARDYGHTVNTVRAVTTYIDVIHSYYILHIRQTLRIYFCIYTKPYILVVNFYEWHLHHKIFLVTNRTYLKKYKSILV